MNTLHLDLSGKTARVVFQPLPEARQKSVVRQLTKAGLVSPVRVLNGINQQLDAFKLTADELIQGDPEILPAQAGELLDLELLTAAYFDPEAERPVPVADFKLTDIVFDAAGQEKERRPYVTRKKNVDDIYPVKIGKRMPLADALTSFVFKQVYQVLHEDGVTKEFLFGIARELHNKGETALLGAGAKGNQPLVVRDKGSPYRAFLFGEIGQGEDEGKYKLLLMLTDQELKRPATPAVEDA